MVFNARYAAVMSINKLVHHMLGNINSISFLLTMVTAAFPNNGALTLGVGALLIWQSLFFYSSAMSCIAMFQEVTGF